MIAGGWIELQKGCLYYTVDGGALTRLLLGFRGVAIPESYAQHLRLVYMSVNFVQLGQLTLCLCHQLPCKEGEWPD